MSAHDPALVEKAAAALRKVHHKGLLPSAEVRIILDAVAKDFRAQALRDAADAWTQGEWSNVILPFPKSPAVVPIAVSQRFGDWLRDCADRIDAGEQP